MGMFSKEALAKARAKNVVEKKHSILVVADEANKLRVLSALLSEEHHVLTASDGQEALALIEREPDRIQLIITDQRMPGLNG